MNRDKTMSKGNGVGWAEEMGDSDTVQGIIVTDRKTEKIRRTESPRISAFIWGGKVKPAPTLPYGRWKGAA